MSSENKKIFYEHGQFLCRDGPAKSASAYSKVKICLTSTDFNLLKMTLFELSQDPECYFVKMSINSKAEMFIGRCFYTSKELAGKAWQKLRSHPQLIANLQDDEVASEFRPNN